MRKLLLLTFLFMFAFQSMSFAAIGGSKGGSAPKSSPRVTQPSPNAAPAAPSKTSEYKPSAPASSYSDKAPAAELNHSSRYSNRREAASCVTLDYLAAACC